MLHKLQVFKSYNRPNVHLSLDAIIAKVDEYSYLDNPKIPNRF